MNIPDPNSDCINLLLQFRKINLGRIWYGNPRIYLVNQQYLVRISQRINLVILVSWNRLYSFHSPLWRVSTIPTWSKISKNHEQTSDLQALLCHLFDLSSILWTSNDSISQLLKLNFWLNLIGFILKSVGINKTYFHAHYS